MDKMVALMSTLQQLYFYSPEGLAMVKYPGTQASTMLRAAEQVLAQKKDEQVAMCSSDLQGSIIGLTGDKTSYSIQYTPYGHDADIVDAPLLRFNSQRKVSVTGHYLLGQGYRGFNPVLMRFNSPDNLSPFGVGGLNSYTYCGGDPVNNTDPSGHKGVRKQNKTGIRPDTGNTKSGDAINPDYSRARSHVVSEDVVATVNELGRNNGSQLQRIVDAPIWSKGDYLVVEGSILTLSKNYGETLSTNAQVSTTASNFHNPLAEQQRRIWEALKFLTPLHVKMKAAEDIPRITSWLHDPKRLVPKVRDPDKAG